MLKWLKSYQSATFETKVFIWTAIIYSLALILGTIYPYAIIWLR